MTAPAAPIPQTRRPSGPLADLRALIDVYASEMRIGIADQFQYRVGNYLYMIGMVAEPVIYLVVWSTIAEQQGGSVGGYDQGQLAAYYIVWTLVRNMNIIFTPYGWEFRIRTGELSGMLLRPLHPIVTDIGYFAGWKFVVIIMWLPIAAILSLLFHPTLAPTPLGVVVFAFAIWGAFLIRMVNYWAIGMVTFWTTRVGPIFELVITLELLLSGRLVPLALMPTWAQQLADVLPFKWTFWFPIEALIGGLTNDQLIYGLGMQVFWIVVGSLAARFAWRHAIKRYSAVGN